MTSAVDPAVAREQARGERWAVVVVGSLALASVIPTAHLVADAYRRPLTARFLAAADWLPADPDDGLPPLERGVATLTMTALVGAVVVFAVLLGVRRLRSARAGGSVVRPVPAPTGTLALTAVAWIVLQAGALFMATGQVVAGQGTDLGRELEGRPGWMLLLPLTLVPAVALSSWRHRRRYGLSRTPWLRVEAEPASPGPPTFREGAGLYGRAMVIEGGFGLAAFAEMVASPTEVVPVLDFATDRLVGAVLFPALLTGLALVGLWLVRATRWVVDDALAQPLVRWSLALLGLGAVLVVAEGVVGRPVAWVGAVALVVGAVLAGLTGLYVQDLGPQPWLGIAFLVLIYTANVTVGDDGTASLPDGAFAWLVAVVLAGFTFWECRQSWRRHLPALVPPEPSQEVP